MPQRSDNYHGGGGWRFSWRPDRMQRLHELGQEFDLTEDRADIHPPADGEPTSSPISPEPNQRTTPDPE